jgi:hypothetical protein
MLILQTAFVLETLDGIYVHINFLLFSLIHTFKKLVPSFLTINLFSYTLRLPVLSQQKQDTSQLYSTKEKF